MMPYFIFGGIAYLAFIVSFLVKYRLSKVYLFVFIITLALFSGLRYETGQDWPAYEDFFRQIDLSQGLLEYFNHGNTEGVRFEFGFYLVNRLFKEFGASYSSVLFISSLFFGFSIFRFFSSIKTESGFLMVSYLGYSFLLLGFAQVRQSIAIAIILTSFVFFLKHRKIWVLLLMSAFSLAFQVSALMYVLPIFGISLVGRNVKMMTGVVSFALIILLSILFLLDIDSIDLLQYLAFNAAVFDKLEIYRENISSQGYGGLIYAGIMVINVLYICFNANKSDAKYMPVHSYALLLLMMSAFSVILFPGFNAMYSRIYVLASLFQAASLSIIFQSNRRRFDFVFIVIVSIIFIVSYFRIVVLYSHEYTPYKTFIFE